MLMPPERRIHFYLRSLLFAIYFIHGIIAINYNSVVSDESEHLYYGLRVLDGKPQKVYADDASTQPVSALNALPRAVEQLTHRGLKKTDGGVSDTIHGRYITLLLCFFIGLYIYRWSKEIYGNNAGLFSLFLFTFCPNLQANIPLVGTDAFAALCTLTSAYYFRKFVLYSGWRYLILFSVQVGLALIVKQSLFLLPLFYGVIALVILLQRKSLFKHARANLLRLFVHVLIVLFIINAAFLFVGTGHSLDRYQFKSDTFRQLQQVPLIASVPLPLPTPFVEGYDGVKQMISIGSGHSQVSGRSYLLGRYFTGNSVWYYYSMIILFKTPLSVLVLLTLAVALNFKKMFKRGEFFRFTFPLTLALFFLVFISLNNTSQHGLRHLLMIYPLIYVMLGTIVQQNFLQPVFTALIILYSAATFYTYFPNLLSYTNELIWNKTNAYKVLASTNIDHGQGGYAVRKYLQHHPDVQWADTLPATGKLLIGINDYLDLKATGHYQWIRKFAPVGNVNHCYLLFTISEKDLEEKNLK